MSGDRTAPPWLWLLLDVPTLSIRDRQNRNVERRHKLYVALPLTCLCLCCRRLLFHLCVVIQAARWDESTATSSSNYFAVKTHRIAWKKKKKSGQVLYLCRTVCRSFPWPERVHRCPVITHHSSSLSLMKKKQHRPIRRWSAISLLCCCVDPKWKRWRVPGKHRKGCVCLFLRGIVTACVSGLSNLQPPHTPPTSVCVSL